VRIVQRFIISPLGNGFRFASLIAVSLDPQDYCVRSCTAVEPELFMTDRRDARKLCDLLWVNRERLACVPPEH